MHQPDSTLVIPCYLATQRVMHLSAREDNSVIKILTVDFHADLSSDAVQYDNSV